MGALTPNLRPRRRLERLLHGRHQPHAVRVARARHVEHIPIGLGLGSGLGIGIGLGLELSRVRVRVLQHVMHDVGARGSLHDGLERLVGVRRRLRLRVRIRPVLHDGY